MVNLSKTKEISFRRPSPVQYYFVPSIDGVELVDHVKSSGVILHQGLSCDRHVSAMLKQCSQRIYLLRMLCSQGLSADHLSTIFVGLIVSRVLYALPAWGVFASVGQSGRIDAFLKCAYKFGFSKDIITFNELLTKSGSSLFLKMQYIVSVSTICCHQKISRLTSLETEIAATFFHSAILVF